MSVESSKKIGLTFGERIGGSAKDKRGYFNIEDIKEMSERELVKEIKKDKIWVKPDYEGLEKEGYDKEVLYFLKQIRDRFPTKPKNVEEDTLLLYILGSRVLESELLKSKELGEDIEGVKSRLYKLVYRGEGEEESKEVVRLMRWEKAYKKVIDYIYVVDVKTIKLEVELHGFPRTYKGAVRGLNVSKGRYRGETGYFIVGSGGVILKEKCYEDYEEAVKVLKEEVLPRLEEEAKSKKQEAVKKAKETKESTERPQLKNIERLGEDVRLGENITAEKFLEEFGFRGGEFGEWQNQKDRQACLNWGYESFKDLAKVLGSSDKFISLDNYGGKRLAIAFGARGKGRALAHYEPAKAVINLTKMNGAGSLAHEWGHALDDCIGIQIGLGGMATERIETKPINVVKENYGELGEELKKLQEEIRYVKDTTEDILAGIEVKKASIRSWLEKNLFIFIKIFKRERYDAIEQKIARWLEGDIVSIGEKLEKEYIERYKEGVEVCIYTIDRIDMSYKRIKEKLEKYKTYERLSREVKEGRYNKEEVKEELKGVATIWFRSAVILDKGSIGGYWSSSVEMFARLFESYIEDELKERGERSDYLVHSTQLNKLVYPTGELREKLKKRMKRILEIVIRSYDTEEGLVKERRELEESKCAKNMYEIIEKEESYEEIECVYKQTLRYAGILEGGRVYKAVKLGEGVYGVELKESGEIKVLRPTVEQAKVLVGLEKVEGEYRLKETEWVKSKYGKYKGEGLKKAIEEGRVELRRGVEDKKMYIVEKDEKGEKRVRVEKVEVEWGLKEGYDIELIKEEKRELKEEKGVKVEGGYKPIYEEKLSIKCSTYMLRGVRSYEEYIKRYSEKKEELTEEEVELQRIKKRYMYKDEEFEEVKKDLTKLKEEVELSIRGEQQEGVSYMLCNESGTSYILVSCGEGERKVGIGVEIKKRKGLKKVKLYKDDIKRKYTLEELKEYCEGLGIEVTIRKVPKSEDKRMLSVKGGYGIKYVQAESEEGKEGYRTLVKYITPKGYVKYYWGSEKGVKGVANELYKLIERELKG